MTDSFDITFLEMAALIGLVQTVSLIVYIVSRAGRVLHVVVPLLCFLVLTGCFLTDFGLRRYEDFVIFPSLHAGLWLFVPAVSVLLMHQIVDFGVWPKLRAWAVLLLPAFGVAMNGILQNTWKESAAFAEIIYVVTGVLAMTTLWFGRRGFDVLREEKEGRGERYWLFICFLVVNLLILSTSLAYVSGQVGQSEYTLIRSLLGVGLVYLASTGLLRIYPPSVKLKKFPISIDDFSNEDKEIIDKIQKLLNLDKVYQEANFSRAQMARELNESEARISKIINAHFGKSLPQLINEMRVQDSLQLLTQTPAPVAVIAGEVGFNSLPTFNRVFKDVMGVSPSDYRQQKKSA